MVKKETNRRRKGARWNSVNRRCLRRRDRGTHREEEEGGLLAMDVGALLSPMGPVARWSCKSVRRQCLCSEASSFCALPGAGTCNSRICGFTIMSLMSFPFAKGKDP
ncbi:hypothetical protein SLE2022_043100 [Rubroshorea leprosula]